MKVILFFIWLICSVVLLDLSLSMVSAANTIENIMGVVLLLALILGSIYTKCLTLITKLWQRK